MNYFLNNLDYIFFFYGLSFLLLAAVSFFLSREKEGSPAWVWLALFGLLHGLNEWLDMLAFIFSDGGGFSAVRLVLMAASFLCLFEFGRRYGAKTGAANAPAWLYAGLLPLAALGGFYGFNGLNAAARYALGLTGGLFACRSLYLAAAGKAPCLRRPLLAVAAAFALYALASGAVVPESALIPARWINQTQFINLFGFPVQLLRGILAMLAAAGAWVYFINIGCGKTDGPVSTGRKAKVGWILIASLLLALAAGWALTVEMGRRAETALVRDSENLEAIMFNRVTDSLLIADQTVAAMSGSPWIPEAFAGGGRGQLARAEAVLDRYCSSYGLSVCYLIDLKGITIASSNRNTTKSFMGKSYAFRPYFTEAGAGGPGFYFALGVTSGERGYYSSFPVRGGSGKILGVAVVKKNLDYLAKDLKLLSYSFLVSPEGIVFISSKPELRFRSLWPVSGSARAGLTGSRQFGDLDFKPVLNTELKDDDVFTFEGEQYYISRAFLEQTGWSLVSFNSRHSVHMARFAGILLSFTLCMLLLAFFLALVQSESAREIAEDLLSLKEEVKTLSGIVPICASCKKIRDDKGYWNKVEVYVAAHTDAQFSHGLCPACAKKLYPEYSEDADSGPEKLR